MSKIMEMIKNEKVEWKKLGDLIDYEQPTKYIVKSTEYDNTYDIPVLTAGQTFILGYTNEKDNIYNANKENPVIIFDDFTSGNHWVDFNFKVKSSAMKILKPKKGINFRYCYHYIKTLNIDTTEHKRLWISKFSNIKIPVPPIKTQEKIVERLDKFVKYRTELQAELQNRSSQYEYFRDLVLSEDYLKKLSQNPEINSYQLRMTTLGEIGEFINGSGMPKSMFNNKGEVGAIHYGHIYTKYSIFVDEPIVKVSKNNAKKLKKVNYGDLVIAKTSENIEDVMKTIAYIGNKEVVTGGHTAIFKHKENPKYLSYLFNGSSSFLKQKNKLANGVKVIEISIEEMKRINILLPPLEIQKKIVEVLDKFQDLISDAEGLLPEEIEQRQKQYEYYREKLLTFENNMVQVKSSQVK